MNQQLIFCHPGHKPVKPVVTLDLLYFHHVHIPAQNESIFVVLTDKVHIGTLEIRLE